MEAAPGFVTLLQGHDLDALERSAETIFGLWPDLRLAYLNPAWHRFAADNGAPDLARSWPLGRSLVDAISGPLQQYYRTFYTFALERPTPSNLTYECSSPTVQRIYRLMAFPLSGAGLLVVHALIHAGSHPCSPPTPPLERHYRDRNGLITQCSHCRRVRRSDETRAWDWIPDWVAESPERTSHGLCPICHGHFYPPD